MSKQTALCKVHESLEGWEGDPPEHQTEVWDEIDSRPARLRYFLATRPSQLFIHFTAKALRRRLKKDPTAHKSIDGLKAKTLAKLRKESVLEPALNGIATWPSLKSESGDEWKHAKKPEPTGSRPLELFLSQVLLELDEAIKESKPSSEIPADISTIAYRKVKDEWVSWGVWKDDWETVPGLTWRHEGKLHSFMKDTNWNRQIFSIEVPQGIGPSEEEADSTIKLPRQQIRRLKWEEEMYQY
ncbi:hypothetical protein GGR57DRAFT_507802 [Xylariaceae sp. FL1272]|nr:hypothetical protein GGR57DRAFT_507802 [Xylariaceae sp. FL1272]